jgi:hypothetical protein
VEPAEPSSESLVLLLDFFLDFELDSGGVKPSSESLVLLLDFFLDFEFDSGGVKPSSESLVLLLDFFLDFVFDSDGFDVSLDKLLSPETDSDLTLFDFESKKFLLESEEEDNSLKEAKFPEVPDDDELSLLLLFGNENATWKIISETRI